MSTDREIRKVVESLLAVSIDTADRAELGAAAAMNARLKAFTAHVDVRLSRRADALACAGECERGFNLLLLECGSGRDAKSAEERDRICTDLPEFECALAAGEVSGEHLDVLVKHTKGLTDAERSELRAEVDGLVDAAVRDSASLFERDVKATVADIKARNTPGSDVDEMERQRAASSVKRWTDRQTGMKMTLLSLDPLRDEALHAAVDAQLAAMRQEPANQGRPFAQLQVDAFVAAVSASAGQFAVPEIVVHVDAGTLCQGRHADTMCETINGVDVPVASLGRFCCDAVVTAVVVEADGTVRRLAEQRTANRQQRRALAAMYSTCAHPHCSVPFSRCRIHRVVRWTDGGPTVIDNMLPVCEHHHHLVHEGGWGLTMTPDREVTWRRPDGTVWMVHHSVNRERPERRARQRSRAPSRVA